MAPAFRIFTTILPSLPDSGDDIEALVGLLDASGPLSDAHVSISLPTITQTQSVFVTETQSLTATVTSLVHITETVTTTLTLAPPKTNRLVVSYSSASTITPLFSTTTLPANTSSSTSSPSSAFSSPLSSSSISAAQSVSIPSPQVPGVPAAPSSLPDQSSSTLSSGAVVGITLASLLIAILLVICFIRQRLRRKRMKDRTWVTPFIAEKPVLRPSVNKRQQKRMEYLAERWARIRSSYSYERQGQNSHREEASTSARMGGGASATRRRNPRANGRTNNLQSSSVARPPAVYRGQPSARRPVRDSPFVSSLFPHGAVAKHKFDPVRPDELAVSAGDHLRVMTLYDDGWAQCRNASGRKGMVPTACLRVNEARRVGAS